jgi:murein DD-endopeptidase MepM/ murein hydrolase activator NlpD
LGDRADKRSYESRSRSFFPSYGRFRKLMRYLGLAAILIALLVILWFWDASPPTVSWMAPEFIGEASQLRLRVQDEGKGLRSISVEVRQHGNVETVFSREYPPAWLPWQQRPVGEEIIIDAKSMRGKASLEEGQFQVEVSVGDQANLWIFSRKAVDVRTLTLDLTPPRIEVLSNPHYLRQGGSEVLIYRVSETSEASGVRVGDRVFSGFPLGSQSKDIQVCLFALAYDESPDAPILAWAQDRAGNRSETGFGVKTFPREFRERRIEVSDSLIEQIAPEILSHDRDIQGGETPLETFLAINSELRTITQKRIDAITSTSRSSRLWNEPFQQLSNSEVQSSFADRRSYYYRGERVDQQTHLGFDLASLAHSPVEAANSGEVVFADYLGIYGNCVILDHGLGLFSLYGHLSTIDVKEGQTVSKGQTLGRTGKTGLAAGDHLHFSMLLQGVQVTPLEGWDPEWVSEHVLQRMDGAGLADSAESSAH